MIFYFAVLAVLVACGLAGIAVARTCRGPVAIGLLVGVSALCICLILAIFYRYHGNGGIW